MNGHPVNEKQVQPPDEFPYRSNVGRHSSRARMVALYAFEFRSRPAWILVFVLTCTMLGVASTMLITGGPLAWQWCLIWMIGCLWSLVPFGTQLRRNIRVAEQRDREGDVLASSFDADAMWVRNGDRLNRFPFGDYTLSIRSKRYGYLAPIQRGSIGVVLPIELFPGSCDPSTASPWRANNT